MDVPGTCVCFCFFSAVGIFGNGIHMHYRDHLPEHLNISISTVGVGNITACEEKETPASKSMDEFPSDYFSQDDRLRGAILVHLIIGFYCFVLIAFVCNDYFLPSVFCICQDLKLSEDIAGATFMASATCLPEMFVNLIGTFLTESDLGVGTVFGSAACNILGVTGCAGLAASKNIKLEVWPLLRDSGIYISVVGVLLAVIADGLIQWYEAALLLALYFAYFVLMFAQKKIGTGFLKAVRFGKLFYPPSSSEVITSRDSLSEPCYGTYRPFYFTDFHIFPDKTNGALPNNGYSNGGTSKSNKTLNENAISICSPPGGFLRNIWWILSIPIAFLLSISIPDCRVHRKFYPVTFFMCIVWIGVCSYIVSWMMAILGYTFNINDAVMGITFLAIGGSIPEASSAVANARRGIGSMTISNALGANTLDILLCLGAPWLIKSLLPLHMNGGPVRLETSDGLVFDCLFLIISVLLLNLVSCVNSFRMNRLYGIICLVSYVIVSILLITTDMRVILNFSTAKC